MRKESWMSSLSQEKHEGTPDTGKNRALGMIKNASHKIPLLPVLVGALLLVIYTVTRIILIFYTGFDSAQ